MSAIQKSEITKRIAKEAGITNFAARTAINILYDIFRETVGEQKSFVIPGVGTVRGEMRPEKMGRDPRDGSPVLCKAKIVAKMKGYYRKKGDI